MNLHRLALLMIASATLAAAIPTDLGRWHASDAESRWVTLRADLEQAPAGLADWVGFLATDRDTQQLEWLALAYDFQAPARALAGLDADNWPRVAWWVATAQADSHSMEAAAEQLRMPLGAAALDQQLADLASADRLARRHRDRIHAWLHAQPGLAATADRWRGDDVTGPPIAQAMRSLPVLDAAAVFAALSPPAVVLDLGPDDQAAPGQTYTHQVRRTLDIFVRAARYQPEWLALVETLTVHSHAGLRAAAWRAFASLPSTLVPYDRALAASSTAEEPVGVRQAAVLALSTSDHPSVDIVLLDLASSAGPLRALAISRLCDRGDGWVLARLDELTIDAAGDGGLSAQRDDLRRRVERAPFPPLVRSMRRAASADLEGDRHAASLAAWTMDLGRRALARPGEPGEQARKMLVHLASQDMGTAPEYVLIRRWATALLEADPAKGDARP